MERTAAGLGMVALVVMWVATPVSAQELEQGTWTGSISLPGGSSLPVTYQVGETDGALSITMSNPQVGDVTVWTGDLGNRTVQKDGLQVELRLERNSCPGTRCYPWTKKPDFSPMSAPA